MFQSSGLKWVGILAMLLMFGCAAGTSEPLAEVETQDGTLIEFLEGPIPGHILVNVTEPDGRFTHDALILLAGERYSDLFTRISGEPAPRELVEAEARSLQYEPFADAVEGDPLLVLAPAEEGQ